MKGLILGAFALLLPWGLVMAQDVPAVAVPPVVKAAVDPNQHDAPVDSAKAQVDWTEIGRWGDRVTVAGEGPRDDGELLYSMALAPPEDESDQWFITLVGNGNAPEFSGLIKAFEKSPELTPFVAAPPGGKMKAWAHFNAWKIEDQSQDWRFKLYKVSKESKLPIVFIQPPRNGHFGNPGMVVDRIEDVSDPAKLKARLTRSVAAYCQKLKASGFVPPAHAVDRFYNITGNTNGLHGAPSDGLIGQVGGDSTRTPPWAIPPSTPFNPSFPNFPPEGPGVPTALTLEQIQAAVPDATGDFILQQLLSKASDVNAVKLAWEIAKKNLPSDQPAFPIFQWAYSLLDWATGQRAQTILIWVMGILLVAQQVTKWTPNAADNLLVTELVNFVRMVQSGSVSVTKTQDQPAQAQGQVQMKSLVNPPSQGS